MGAEKGKGLLMPNAFVGTFFWLCNGAYALFKDNVDR